ncbi:MAG: sn-glycerol-3-phosphate ABC transporter ATP-binding protein UgpC [Desulfotalea sp.]
MAQIGLKNLEKKYGKVQVVKGIDLQVHDSEFIVLVGPSGCGKSTVLRMIAGLEDISGGEIYIDDRIVNKVPPEDRNVAMVFQNYALYPHMTVRDNIGFSLKMAKVPVKERYQKIAKVAQILELSDYLDRKPAELSGGQRQRVAMGRAIIRKADVFLFDEPLSNLDAQLRTQMRIELKKMHLKLKTTTVYVTHDQTEAMTLADRIVILKDGSIQQVGTPIEIFESPNNVFVAQFIGNPPMNIFSATIQSNGESRVLKSGNLTLPLCKNIYSSVSDGDEVLVGIRPDAIKARLTDIDTKHQFDTKVVIAEILGGQTHVELELEGTSIMAEIEGRFQAKPGDDFKIGIDLERTILFNPQTTQALTK